MSSDQAHLQNLPLYTYTPLSITATSPRDAPITRNAIRLVTVECTSSREEVQVTIEHSTIADDYIAVTYMWGPAEPVNHIYTNGCRLTVRDNIYRFLKHNVFHGAVPNVKLWIDSICINQNNLSEKSQQVSMMGTIFSKATQVLVWLGDASEDDSLLRYAEARNVDVQEIKWSDFLDDTTIGQANPGDRGAENHLGLIINNAYWTRLWVLQEMMLAKDLKIIFGRTKISLKAVKSMRDFCSTDWQKYLTGRKPKLMSSLPVEIGDSQNALYSIAHWIQSSSERGQGFRFGTLMELLNRFGRQRCANPRDKIYGLLGLTWHIDHAIHVDYACTVAELFARVVHFMQQEVRSLDPSEPGHCPIGCAPPRPTAAAMHALAVTPQSLRSLPDSIVTTAILHISLTQHSSSLSYENIDRGVQIKLGTLLPGTKESNVDAARLWECSIGNAGWAVGVRWLCDLSATLRLENLGILRHSPRRYFSGSSRFQCRALSRCIEQIRPICIEDESKPYVTHVPFRLANLVQILTIAKNFVQVTDEYETHRPFSDNGIYHLHSQQNA